MFETNFPVRRCHAKALVEEATIGMKRLEITIAAKIEAVSKGTPKQAVSFGFPNTFWIVSEAPHYQPEPADSEPM